MIARCLLLLLAVLLLGASAPPRDLTARAGFDQRLGAALPLPLRLTNAYGREDSLAGFADGRPIILAMGYFRCPNLCDTVWQSLAHAVAGAGLHPGRDVAVFFVSIDPAEGPADARQVQQSLQQRWPSADPAAWHFLSGAAPASTALARAIGFRYFYDDALRQYAHPAGIVVASGQGRIAQYLFGVEYQPQSLRLAVVEASQGRLGSLSERLVLLCCGYDPSTGRYSLLIGKSMRLLGCVFAAGLLVALVVLARQRGDA